MRRTIDGIRFDIKSPSLYICVAAPDIKIFYGGKDWFLIFTLKAGAEATICDSFPHALALLKKEVQAVEKLLRR